MCPQPRLRQPHPLPPLGPICFFLCGPSADTTTKPPPFLALRSSTLFITFTVCLAIFTDILLYGLIVPVIPFSLTVQAGVPEERVQHWTAILLACYNVALCVGSPIAGLYADRTASRRLPLLAGLLALAGATILLCLGRTIAVLVAGRLLQGLSAAIVWSVGLALLVDTMGRDVGFAMGWVSIAMSVALLISPVIGGAVYAAAGYYAVFYIAFGVICCDVVLRLVLIEKKVARRWVADGGSDADAAGAPAPDGDVEAGAAHVGVVGASKPDTGESIVVDFNSSGGSNPAADRHPYLELFRSRRIIAALLAVVVEAGIVFGCDTVLPLFVKDTFNWNPTAAGLIFICLMVPGFASPLVGKLADRYGAKWPTFAGFALTVPLLVCLRFVTDNTLNHKILLCALLTLLGVTLLTLANTPLLAEMAYAIDAKEATRPGVWGNTGVYGVAYGLWTTGYALGGTVGSLMAGYLKAGPGWATTTWSLAILCAAGVLVTLGFGPRPNKRISSQD
ncbi:major facilitator superfamily domain-containing protein [Lasiosphaeria hispida]|uniref:Major facilitator superfamily domain-containing protein n=1 Tax=Lasiosphaeria hispida TaxID=260671 RepID=A0AAJ0MIE8_9PEZI|nr:major facilitator superfamily domain-containing protein [Lasiosphaeria hispida]